MPNKKPLYEEVDNFSFSTITQKVMATRKVINEVDVTYEDIDHEVANKVYKVKSIHIPLEEVFKFARSSCRQCSYGKGFFVTNIPKDRYPNPKGLMVLEPEMPEDLTDEQKEIYQAKLDKITTWKTINVCKCAYERALQKNPNWVATANRNVFVELDYTIEDIPEEPKEEKVETKDKEEK